MGIMPQARATAAPPAAATGFGQIVGIQRFAKHLVEGLRAGPKLRGVGFPDRDSACCMQALDKNLVLVRYKIFEDRRSERCANAL
jgi:hypothetical protein